MSWSIEPTSQHQVAYMFISEAPRSLHTRQVQILGILLRGSQLTVEQLASATGIRVHTVRRAVHTLEAAGLLVGGVGLRRTAWQTTPLAHRWARKPRGGTALGIPADEAAS